MTAMTTDDQSDDGEIDGDELAGWVGGAGRPGRGRRRTGGRQAPGPGDRRTYRFRPGEWNQVAGGLVAGMMWTVQNAALLGDRPVRFFCYGREAGPLGRVSVARVDGEPLFFINGWGWTDLDDAPARPGAFQHLAGWTDFSEPAFGFNLADVAAYRIYGDRPEEEVEQRGRRAELPILFGRKGIDLERLFAAYREYVAEELIGEVHREATSRGLLGFLDLPAPSSPTAS